MNWILLALMIALCILAFRWSFAREVRKLDTEIAYVL